METEKIFYILGKIFLIIGILTLIVLYVTDFKIISGIAKCVFFEKTGLYCPGCGGTRAVISLLRGNIVLSFLYHPFVIFFTVTYTVFMVYEFCKKHFKLFKKIFPVEIMCYIGVGILILQWIVKVILQFTL